jgi:hypothetical protein
MLPEPMLARPDALLRGDYSYEVKWDGFRGDRLAFGGDGRPSFPSPG